jgi:hypothetical protein
MIADDTHGMRIGRSEKKKKKRMETEDREQGRRGGSMCCALEVSLGCGGSALIRVVARLG